MITSKIFFENCREFFILGLFLAFCYEFIRIAGAFFDDKKRFIFNIIWDILFLAAAGFFTFIYYQEFVEGDLKPFYFFAEFLGAAGYLSTIGKVTGVLENLIVKQIKKFVYAFFKVMKKIIIKLTSPFIKKGRAVFSMLKKWFKLKITNYQKKIAENTENRLQLKRQRDIIRNNELIMRKSAKLKGYEKQRHQIQKSEKERIKAKTVKRTNF